MISQSCAMRKREASRLAGPWPDELLADYFADKGRAAEPLLSFLVIFFREYLLSSCKAARRQSIFEQQKNLSQEFIARF